MNGKIIQQKKMKNKYYTPSIEDIRVGYECEVYARQGISGEYDTEPHYEKDFMWYPHRFGRTTFSWIDQNNERQAIDDILAIGDIKAYRTPYLTKEQVKGEGWGHIMGRNKDEFWATKEIKNEDLYWYSLHFDFESKKLGIYGEEVLPNDNHDSTTIFYGNCPSINEFRYISKILGI